MSMTLKDFREWTKDLPDDAVIYVDEGDIEFVEVSPHGILPATADQPPLIWLQMGQTWTYEVNGHPRVDAWLEGPR